MRELIGAAAFGLASLWAVTAAAAGGIPIPEADGAPFEWVAKPDRIQAGVALSENLRARAAYGDRATVQCTVGAKGRLEDCVIADERPSDTGVGKAILAITKYYKAASKDAAGAPTRGRQVRFTFAYAGTAKL